MVTLREAVERARAAVGGGAALARELNLKRQAVYQWDKVPPLRVLEVERATGIPRHVLRPDLYPPPAPPEQVVSA
jgi:DNA-binding transcriptional regulator YdaS (Cro superfamily)